MARDWHTTKVNVTAEHRTREARGWGEKTEWEDEIGWHLRERGQLSLKIAACHFLGKVIILLFIGKCQETIFSFNLMGSTPSQAVSKSRKWWNDSWWLKPSKIDQSSNHAAYYTRFFLISSAFLLNWLLVRYSSNFFSISKALIAIRAFN